MPLKTGNEILGSFTLEDGLGPGGWLGVDPLAVAVVEAGGSSSAIRFWAFEIILMQDIIESIQ